MRLTMEEIRALSAAFEEYSGRKPRRIRSTRTTLLDAVAEYTGVPGSTITEPVTLGGLPWEESPDAPPHTFYVE